MLVDAFAICVKNIKRLFEKPVVKLFFMDMFEREWSNFVFIDYENLNKVVKSPWSLVPVFEEKHRKKLPDFLKPAIDLYQETKNALQQFLSLRHMILHFQWRSGIEKLKEFPFKFEERDVYSWKIGEHYVVQNDKTLVLCSLQIGETFDLRYVVLDPEFFILIEPYFKEDNHKTIRIEIKAPLEKIDFKIDSYDNKRLTITINEVTEKGELNQNTFLMHFESSPNCRSVRKTIEDNRKIKKYFQDTLIVSFLDR